jgi:hypothetical protein
VAAEAFNSVRREKVISFSLGFLLLAQTDCGAAGDRCLLQRAPPTATSAFRRVDLFAREARSDGVFVVMKLVLVVAGLAILVAEYFGWIARGDWKT